MKEKITDPEKDPLGRMIRAYLNGAENARVRVASPTLDMWEMSGQVMFRPFGAMNRIERKALSLCRGKILDVGAGSGCHSRYLQKKGYRVDALDISPGCVEVMEKRGIDRVIHGNLFSIGNRRFDTLLMLMNGIGICGSLDGLNLFFQFARTILTQTGQILADSTDLETLYDTSRMDIPEGQYPGETEFVMTYEKIIGDPFDWLYIDFDTLAYYAGFHDLVCEKIMTDRTGKYLARITLPA